MRDVSNRKDVIDSRDVIARIEELEEERDSFEAGSGEAREGAESWAEAFPEEAEELKILSALAEEAEGYASDWRHGEALIRDTHFEDYARQLAEDIGAIKGNESWPLNCIDWERAASELKYDYTSVDFGGVEYWIRS